MADSYHHFWGITMRRFILLSLLIALLCCSAWSYTLTCDNGTNHRYYEIVGSPWGRLRVESSGSRKGVRYQYKVWIDDNESSPNTFSWTMRRWSPPLGEWGDNTTGVPLSDSGNASLNNGDVYFDLGNATGHNLSDSATYYLSNNATGYLHINVDFAPKGRRCIKIRALGDNDTIASKWVQWCYNRSTFDGNYTYDTSTTDVDAEALYYNIINYDVIEGGHSIGMQMGAH